ncbi:MAG: DUF5666 domain-containing protein [Rhodothermales bacterium]
MKSLATSSSLSRLLSLIFLIGAFAMPALAQENALHVSKSRSFLTDDQSFDRADTLFVRAVLPNIDYTSLDQNELRLKPDNGGGDLFAQFTNQLDGSFTLALPLASADLSESDWEIRLRLGDRFGFNFERRIDVTVGRDSNSGGDDSNDEIEFKAFIEAIDAGTVTVGGIAFLVDDQTDVRDRGNDRIDFSSLVVGDFVEIRADRAPAGRWLASRIKLDDSFEGAEVEFTGVLDYVDADSIIVAGVTFMLSGSTDILNDDNLPISVFDLFVGAIVEVRGVRSGSSPLTATRVKIEDDFQSEDEIELTGVIEAIDSQSITVNGTLFSVDDRTVVTDHANQPASFASLVVGETVEIKGFRQADGSVRAVRIHREDRGEDEVELTGLVEAIEGTSLVVAGLTFETNDRTLILDNDRLPIAFADLVVGLVVEIRADVQPDGRLLATDIKIEDRIEDEVEVRGLVDSASDSVMVILGQSFHILPSTVFVDNAGAPSALSAFSAGDIAEIEATLQPGGLIVALHVQKENGDPDRVVVRGPVTAVGDASVTVIGIELAWDGDTQFFDRDNNATDVSAIQAGQGVKATATRRDGDLPLASVVEIKSTVVMAGTLTAVDGAQITMAGATFQVSPTALVLGRFNAVVADAQLEVGQLVEVSATQENGVAVVSTVRLIGAAVTVGTAIEEGRDVPSAFTLHGNYPNPFNPTTNLVFDLSASARVDVQVFDLLGRQVMALPAEAFDAGASHQIQIDAAHLASGMYLYRLTATSASGPIVQTGRMLLMK